MVGRSGFQACFLLSLAASLLGNGAIAQPTQVKPSAALVKTGAQIDVNSPYGSHLQPILEKIKATPDQRQKISQIVGSYRTQIQPLRDEYKQKRQDFINQMTSGGAAETIMAKQLELSHLSSNITAKYTLMRIEIRKLLTPQQVLQFEEYARQHGWNH